MPISNERVSELEGIRTKGSRQQQIDLVGNQLPLEAGIDVFSVSGLPKQDLVNYMRAWRIWTTTLMQLYKRKWHGDQAAKFLWEAKNVATQYYNHSQVMEAARGMKTDPEGHDYQMRAEMLRDEGKLALCLAELTGNPVLIREATNRFELAILAAEEGSATRALAAMEHKIALKRSGIGIDWPWFKTNYQTIANSTKKSGNYDRLATASWMYAKQAILGGKKAEFTTGFRNLQAASKNLGANWVKHPLKEIMGVPLAISRRLTYSTEPQYFESAGH